MAAGPLSSSAVLPSNSSARLSRPELLLLLVLVLGAFAIRLYRLGEFPDTVLADEADNAQDSVRALYGQTPENGFFGIDWTSQPAFSLYKEAAFIALFGFNVQAMRLSSAVLSSLALIPFFLLLRRQFGKPAAFGATALLATEVWYLNFSRSGWNIVDTCLYLLLAMLFLMTGLDRLARASERGWRLSAWFAAAGFCCALGLYAYPAGRTSTLAILLSAPLALFLYRPQARVLLLQYVVLFSVEALVFAPQGLYVLRHWEHFNGRANTVLLMNNDAYKADPAGTLLQQLDKNLRGPWDGTVDIAPQYSPRGKPMISRVTGILALLGMALSLLLARLRTRFETWLWWAVLSVGWVSTQIITVQTPNGARGLVYMPTFVYFAGAGLDAILRLLGRIKRGALRKAALGLLALAVAAAAYINVKQYVDWQSDPQTRQARYLYITVREFPQWAQAIAERAATHQGSMNVGQWREAYPIQDPAHP